MNTTHLLCFTNINDYNGQKIEKIKQMTCYSQNIRTLYLQNQRWLSSNDMGKKAGLISKFKLHGKCKTLNFLNNCFIDG